MRRAGGALLVVALLLCASSGCGTMANLRGEEPWLMGWAPKRPTAPFGGLDNDVRWMKRCIGPNGWHAAPIVVGAIDMPFSLVGDIVTLPWTAYQAFVVARNDHEEVDPPPAASIAAPN